MDVDANTGPGTDPVIADGSGEITVAGAAVANHSVPVETHSRAANTMNVEVQVSAAVTGAPGDTNDAGICSFDDVDFAVDGDGYVTLLGGGTPGESLTHLSLVDDFLYRWGSSTVGSSSVWGKLGWFNSWSISATTGASETTVDRPGVLYVSTSGGTKSMHLGGLLVGGGVLQMTWIIKLDSTGAGRIRAGLLGMSNTGSPPVQNDGIYFKWENGVNSGNWQVITAAGGTFTTGNTAVAGSTNWINLKYIVNAAGTSVQFLIDGVEPAGSPITTNIPTAVTRPYFSGNKNIYMDFFQLEQNLTGSR